MFEPVNDFISQACCQLLVEVGAKPSVAMASSAMDKVFALAEESWKGRRSSLDYIRSAPIPACKAGCGWCCHQQVGVAPLEAIRIFHHLTSLPPAEGGPLIEAARTLDSRIRGKTTAERAESGLACAFLGVDGSCQIYAVRPLRCRGLYSIDADFCAACTRDPVGMKAKLERGEVRPVYLSVPEAIFNSALSGVLMASRRLKWTLASLELTAAVVALLDKPRLADRWLAGARPDKDLMLRR